MLHFFDNLKRMVYITMFFTNPILFLFFINDLDCLENFKAKKLFKREYSDWLTFTRQEFIDIESGFFSGTKLEDLVPNHSGNNSKWKFMNKNINDYLSSLWEACAEKYFHLKSSDHFGRTRRTSYCLWDAMLKTFNLYSVFSDKKVLTNQPWWPLDLELMSLIWIYMSCTQHTRDIFCPKPCKNKPCKRKIHKDRVDWYNQFSCITSGESLFKDDYKCICKENFIWNKEKKLCVEQDFCQGSYCVLENVVNCTLDTSQNFMKIKCHCKAEFYGDRCEIQYNACSIESHPILTELRKLKANVPKTGDELCRFGIINQNFIAQQPKCVPLEKNFICQCPQGYRDNHTEIYPNCNIRDLKCRLCSEAEECDLKKTNSCRCHGRIKDCNKYVDKWGPWKEWSDCPDSCNQNIRFIRRRSRKCETHDRKQAAISACSLQGGGVAIQEESCHGEPCIEVPKWGPWSNWGKCTRTCGGGYRTKGRNCIFSDIQNITNFCHGSHIVIEVCSLIDCKRSIRPSDIGLKIRKSALEWGLWLPWSKCGWTGNCGKDLAIRLRSCNDGSGACFGSAFDVINCYKKCSRSYEGFHAWQPWTSCNKDQTTCSRVRNCTAVGHKQCRGFSKQVAQCQNKICVGGSPRYLSRTMLGLSGMKMFDKEINFDQTQFLLDDVKYHRPK
ncbi:DgyrCDS6392 [Dimorphilus gyrociliatus]|nr:DgyrCDS6392 [Dimorphilus gyrociliatus]